MRQGRLVVSAVYLLPFRGIHLRGYSSNKFTQQPPLSGDHSLPSSLACSFCHSLSLCLPFYSSMLFYTSLSFFFSFCAWSFFFFPLCLFQYCESVSGWLHCPPETDVAALQRNTGTVAPHRGKTVAGKRVSNGLCQVS